MEGSGGTHEDARVDDPALLEALSSRSAGMASRAYEVFAGAFPEAGGWTAGERARFLEQARRRFESILAVVARGDSLDRGLVADLREVGAGAAESGSPLPPLLVVLRISRDLVVQTAVEVAEERGRSWVRALGPLVTRAMTAVDQLTDAVAQGYWQATTRGTSAGRAPVAPVVPVVPVP